MNPFSFIAFILCWGAVFGAQMLDGGHPGSLFSHPGPLLLVFGGSLAASAIGSQMGDIKTALVALKHAYLGKKLPKLDQTIANLSELANAARGDGGLMAMEAKVKDFAGDPFLTRGVELILDGVDPEEMRDLLESDISAMEERHKVGAKFWEMAGGYAPTIGIVGTVMSLVHVMENLDDPDSLGPAIGAAFLATLWGVAAANVIYLPIQYKLKRLSALEVAHRELVIEGLLAVHIGKTPRQVEDRMKSYLSHKQRQKMGGKAS